MKVESEVMVSMSGGVELMEVKINKGDKTAQIAALRKKEKLEDKANITPKPIKYSWFSSKNATFFIK